MTTKELIVHLKTPHEKQREFIESSAKRKIIRAGRRSGKTTGLAMQAVDMFLEGHRVLYAAPTSDQTDKFWLEVSVALRPLVDEGLLRLNQTSRFIERRGTENRVKAKTAWDSNTLRGDYADFLIMDEYQLMSPDTWDDVGAPMLLDNDGDAVFIYTPPRPGDRVKGPHAQQMFKRAKADESGRYEAFHFTSFDNPHISAVALNEITEDMSDMAYRREIMAEDIEDHPDALWNREIIERFRVDQIDELEYIVVPIDPPATVGTCGIVPCGRKTIDGVAHAFVLNDVSLRGRPDQWAARAVSVYHQLEANYLIGEINNGGDMIENTIKNVPGGDTVAYKQVRASRGKATRAEPVASLYAQGRVHHVGDPAKFREFEDELTNWVPGMAQSPDRLDSSVWGITELLLLSGGWARRIG
jgi:hypothetical protein